MQSIVFTILSQGSFLNSWLRKSKRNTLLLPFRFPHVDSIWRPSVFASNLQANAVTHVIPPPSIFLFVSLSLWLMDGIIRPRVKDSLLRWHLFDKVKTFAEKRLQATCNAYWMTGLCFSSEKLEKAGVRLMTPSGLGCVWWWQWHKGRHRILSRSPRNSSMFQACMAAFVYPVSGWNHSCCKGKWTLRCRAVIIVAINLTNTNPFILYPACRRSAWF